jgi:hypothetical protein
MKVQSGRLAMISKTLIESRFKADLETRLTEGPE